MHYRDCYFGLSPSVPKETESSEKIGHNLALLTNNHTIDNKIFSFEKWEIKDNLISSKFLIGDSHDHFKVEDGYIGQCKMTDNEYWGCSFKEMTFNNAIISLSKEDKTLYKIYFASETNDIILPNKFRNILVDASNKKCNVKIGDIDYYLFCDDLNDQGYIPLRLSNEDMNITLEIDYAFNYSKNTEILKSKTRIKFQDINYMIFPLMMFLIILMPKMLLIMKPVLNILRVLVFMIGANYLMVVMVGQIMVYNHYLKLLMNTRLTQAQQIF